MLRSVDVRAVGLEGRLAVGDLCRFPVRSLDGEDEPYRHSWEVSAFLADGAVEVARLADGRRTRVAARHVVRWLVEGSRAEVEGRAPVDSRSLRDRARREARAWNPERPEVEGHEYYASAVRGRRRVLLSGPYGTHRTAVLDLPRVTALAGDPWAAYGTASAPVGSDLPVAFGSPPTCGTASRRGEE